MLIYDIVIIGGGISGTMAAISAARMGSSVLIVEEHGFLGGSLTACGTGPMMTFHAGEKQVIKGITNKLIERLKNKGLSVGHIVDTTGYTYSVTPFDAEGMKRELEIMAIESGCEILFHTMLQGVEMEEGKISSIVASSGCQSIKIKGRIYIDASGDGDLCILAGIKMSTGRDVDHKNQPMTMNLKLSNVNINSIRALMSEKRKLFPLLADKAGIEKNAARISCSGFNEAINNARDIGEISYDRDMVLFFETNTPNEVIVNMTRINNLDPTDALSLSKAEIEGRRQAWETYYFLKRNIPGFEEAKLIYIGPNIGIRTSRRLIGNYILTYEDLFNEKKFDDAIACCGYPIDIHSSDGAQTNSIFLRKGAWYTIPYRSLITSECQNLIVAGRIISTDFESQASTRVSPCCGATGQAAGTAAAMALNTEDNVGNVDIKSLQKQLISDDAFIA